MTDAPPIKALSELDPKGLIRESYQIEGISAPECRSIFVDWALSLPIALNQPQALSGLIAHYAPKAPDHPMTVVMRDWLKPAATPQRRGGRAGRFARKV